MNKHINEKKGWSTLELNLIIDAPYRLCLDSVHKCCLEMDEVICCWSHGQSETEYKIANCRAVKVTITNEAKEYKDD